MKRWSLLALCLAAPVSAQREPVLEQIVLPHAYYYREMYLPQVTSGPSTVTWSPDGQSVIYSMQGSLWRQRLGTTEAEQLTAGPGYDFQPDWSPDGRSVVYVSYRGDAEELRLLDLASGDDHPLTVNGAVNVDPRWSPDGSRLAFVSTVYQGRFHIYVATIKTGQLDAVRRVTEDHDSHLPRYYYSVFDHYLSPTWSPDGAELLFVSNRGHVWGTGGLWRAPADSGPADRARQIPAQPGSVQPTSDLATRSVEIRNEETAWKPHPDWSRDGHRVVYSSFAGRQWNQLWLTTPNGDFPVQLTYGDFDATVPRWSPDGGRIAFIANEGGNTSLRIVAVPGGAVSIVTAKQRHYKGAVGVLRVMVRDATGHPMPGRVSVSGRGDRTYAPDDAWRYADDSFDRKTRRLEIGYFQTTGASVLTVPAESVTVDVSRGLEYRPAHRRVAIKPGDTTTVVVGLPRMANLPPEGWYSGDLHVHMNYGGTYRNTTAHLAEQARAEDVHVIEDLIVNKEGRIPDVGSFIPGGRADPASDANTLIVHGQEFHTSYWGHAGLLGLRSSLILPGYAAYASTPVASLVPTNADVAGMAHADRALLGYVHPFDVYPDPADMGTALTDELPVDVALGAVDYMEIVGFSDHLSTARVWYQLLNCGFRLPAGAGTDAMANYASLRGPVGLNRVFVHAGSALWHGAWLDSLKAGRSFATNGPLLTLTIDGHAIGDEIKVAGPTTLHIHATLASIVSVDHFELVGPSGVVASVALTGDRTTATADWTVTDSTSAWYTVRAYADHAADPAYPILDTYPFATTSPIYVTVANRPMRSPRDAQYFAAWIARLAAGARNYTGYNTPAERAHVLAQLDSAAAVFGH